MGRNGIDREIDVATFVFSGTSERSGEVSETLDAKRAPRPPASLASRVFALPRRSCRMVSSRAYSSTAPQPASRHIIKPFSIEPIIANIRCTAVSTSHYRFAIGDGVAANLHSLFRRKTSYDLNPALLRMLAMMAIAIGRVGCGSAGRLAPPE